MQGTELWLETDNTEAREKIQLRIGEKNIRKLQENGDILEKGE